MKKIILLLFISFSGSLIVHGSVGTSVFHRLVIYNSENEIMLVKLKNTDILSSQIITLPIYPSLKNSEVNYITKIIKKWYSYNYEKK